MKKGYLSLLITLFIIGCGSPKIDERELEEREHEEIKRDYVVRDASSNYKPAWVEDAELWAKQAREDTEKFRYFSYETEPKSRRSTACQLAEAKTKSEIAGEITTFIERSLGEQTEGEASIDLNNPVNKPMKEFVETSLTQKTMAMIHGAAISKKYWEKRQYLKDKGAKADFTGYTCSVLVRMGSDQLEELVRRASDFVSKQADPDMKAKVEKALEKADENFVKHRKGIL